jgi:hypothetical protein
LANRISRHKPFPHHIIGDKEKYAQDHQADARRDILMKRRFSRLVLRTVAEILSRAA